MIVTLECFVKFFVVKIVAETEVASEGTDRLRRLDRNAFPLGPVSAREISGGTILQDASIWEGRQVGLVQTYQNYSCGTERLTRRTLSILAIGLL